MASIPEWELQHPMQPTIPTMHTQTIIISCKPWCAVPQYNCSRMVLTQPKFKKVVLPIQDVVSGMKYLHLAKPPVLHLDVKSLNLLIDANFRTKVADFGLVGKKGKGIGSAQWMAPEMLRCEIPTTAADVYSFGVVMFEIYSRKEPYAGDQPNSLLVY